MLLAIIPLAFLGLPFPSGNPDGFEKATFEDSRVGEPEAGILPGVDLGPFGDLLTGPLGIILVFGFTIGLFYLVKKMSDVVRQPKFLVFASFFIMLVILLIIPLTLATGAIRWDVSIEFNSNAEWKFTMEHTSLDRLKYTIEDLNGQTNFIFEFRTDAITHSIDLNQTLHVNYALSTTYYSAEGPQFTLSTSNGETSLTIEMSPTEGATYALESTSEGLKFSSEITSGNLIYILEQNEGGLIQAINIQL